MAESSREVLFTILYYAILEIRMYATDNHANGAAIGVLANIIHHLPVQLKDASSPEQHDQLLYEAWDRCDERGRAWLSTLLVDRGFDPSEFPATDYRTQ